MEGGINKKWYDYILEKIAPIVALVLILLPGILVFIDTQATIIYLVIIYVYFFYKSAAVAVQFAIGLNKIRTANQINWMELINGFDDIKGEISRLKEQKEAIKKYSWTDFLKERENLYKKLQYTDNTFSRNSKLPNILQRYLIWVEKRKTIGFINQEINLLKHLEQKGVEDYKDLQHIIIIPHVKEPKELLRQTLDHLKNQTFNTKQINIVLAAEAADPNGVAVSEDLRNEYKDVFNNIWITNHVLQETEIVGKSANMNWAGREVYKKVKELGWDLKKTTVTSCDADSKLDPQYYAYLSFKYLTINNPEYKYYASAMIFYNNLWRLPFYARVLNSFRTVFNVSNLIRTDKLVPFSTYTTSFWVLEQIGFWDPWVTPEDYHLFLKAVFKIDKHVETVPIYLKTMSDSAEGDTHWKTIKNNYMQSRRWAWGISDDGWMIKNLIKSFFRLSIIGKYKVAHVLMDHIMGLSVPFIIAIGGIIPGLIDPNFYDNVSAVLFPIVSGRIIQSTFVFMVIVIYLDYFFRPQPENFTKFRKFLSVIEWITQPFASFLLAAIPGLEAQTRLLFGRYLEYYVTKKTTAKDKEESNNTYGSQGKGKSKN